MQFSGAELFDQNTISDSGLSPQATVDVHDPEEAPEMTQLLQT
eukprot:gene11850-28767_t